MTDPATVRQQALRDALDHLRAALELLDRAGAPPQIGAHVDLGAHHIQSALGDLGEPAPSARRLAPR